jgi:hypothetical protein
MYVARRIKICSEIAPIKFLTSMEEAVGFVESADPQEKEIRDYMRFKWKLLFRVIPVLYRQLRDRVHRTVEEVLEVKDYVDLYCDLYRFTCGAKHTTPYTHLLKRHACRMIARSKYKSLSPYACDSLERKNGLHSSSFHTGTTKGGGRGDTGIAGAFRMIMRNELCINFLFTNPHLRERFTGALKGILVRKLRRNIAKRIPGYHPELLNNRDPQFVEEVIFDNDEELVDQLLLELDVHDIDVLDMDDAIDEDYGDDFEVDEFGETIFHAPNMDI